MAFAKNTNLFPLLVKSNKESLPIKIIFNIQSTIMRYVFIVFTMAFMVKAIAQKTVQQVRGQVLDRDSRQVLPGATISVSSMENVQTITADSMGYFIFPAVHTGRIRIQCSFTGYEDYFLDDIILNAAKELEVTIEIGSRKQVQQSVLVRTTRNPKLPVNKYALVSGRSFTAEETQRFPASANDPGRMAMALPGVQATRDTRSDIIIRGNNPVGLQWKIEGVDVVNPNHFARKGSSGGGITILSLSMLDQSDFLTGAMPAEYGDALSGVFDMHLRKGNNKTREYTFKAGLIGLDFSTEGPIKKNESSYLVNYRYSTLGLLQTMGLHLVDERESNTFQDLSFNLSFGNAAKKSQWNVWGIGGISREKFKAVEDTSDWKQFDDYAVYDYRTKMGAIGLGQTLRLNESSFLKSSLALIGQWLEFMDDTLNRNRSAFNIGQENYDQSRISLSSAYNYKFSAITSFKTGLHASMILYNLSQKKFDFGSGNFRHPINESGKTILFQPYLQMSLRPGKWTINPGVHVIYLALNGNYSIDPRLSFQYRISGTSNISLAYGIHSKTIPIGSYFLNTPGGYPNENLDMMRAHHLILAYEELLGRGWRLRSEIYYQRLFNIPVVNDASRTYWMLNELDGYAKEPLVSKGKGSNRGIDLSIEKSFTRGFFTIASLSIFKSEYKPLNGTSYSTRFNSGRSGSWTAAKEWSMKKNKVLQLGWKMIYNGGLPLTPLAANQSSSREAILDETRPYSERVPDYFRTDARISLRKDKSRISWQLAIDIQNVFGIKNIDGLSRRFDPSVNQWIYKTQSGFVPILSYQVDF